MRRNLDRGSAKRDDSLIADCYHRPGDRWLGLQRCRRSRFACRWFGDRIRACSDDGECRRCVGQRKEYIEGGEYGGKGSDNHNATIVGDTVGDPFKDTSGPSLNILIKLMSMVSVVFAGLIAKYGDVIGGLLGMG